MGVGQHLHLDLAGAFDVALGQQGVVAEAGAGLAPRGGQLGHFAHDAHPPAAAARGRGVPSLPGTTATSACAASSLAATLSPRRSMAAGGGPTNTSPASAQARAKSARSDRNP